MLKHYDFYVASPFFNDEQIDRVDCITNILHKKGLVYYSPKDELICSEKPTDEEAEKVFFQNCVAIHHSGGVIVITNDKDIGAIWEAGFGYGLGKKIIYVCTQPIVKFNLMLAQSGVAVFTSVRDFEQYDFARMPENKYKGLIE